MRTMRKSLCFRYAGMTVMRVRRTVDGAAQVSCCHWLMRAFCSAVERAGWVSCVCWAALQWRVVRDVCLCATGGAALYRTPPRGLARPLCSAHAGG
jgi:hypothetical protein